MVHYVVLPPCFIIAFVSFIVVFVSWHFRYPTIWSEMRLHFIKPFFSFSENIHAFMKVWISSMLTLHSTCWTLFWCLKDYYECLFSFHFGDVQFVQDCFIIRIQSKWQEGLASWSRSPVIVWIRRKPDCCKSMNDMFLDHVLQSFVRSDIHGEYKSIWLELWNSELAVVLVFVLSCKR